LAAFGLAGVLLASCGGGSSLPSTLANKTGAQLLAFEKKAFTSEGYVYAVEAATYHSEHATTVSYTARNVGYEVDSGAQGSGTLVYNNGVIDIKGNTQFLDNDLDTSADVSQLVNKLITVPSTYASYAQLEQGMTISSAIANSLPVGPFKINGTGLFDGHQTLKVTGKVNKSVTGGSGIAMSMYVGLTKPYLPVGLSIQGTLQGAKIKATLKFSLWGKQLTLPTVVNPTVYTTSSST
jgi:hypothetical protein